MAKIKQECLDAALQALQHFDKTRLSEYIRDVFVRAKSYDDVPSSRAFDRAEKEINDAYLKSYFEDASIKANNIVKYELNAQKLEGKANMRGLLISRGEDMSRNLSAAQKDEFNRIVRQVLGDMSHEEVEYFSSGKFDEVIADIHDGKKLDDPVARKIADKLKDYFVFRNSRMILSNAMKFDEINEDRLFRAVHDQVRIINAGKSLIKVAREKVTKKYDLAGHRDAWKNTIKKYINLDATFQHTDAMGIDGKLDMGQVDKILDRIFNNITTGKSNIFTRSVVANDREAMAKKSRMFFKWKGLRDLYEYNRVYGRGNLFSMMIADAQSTADRAGVANLWGDNPYSMYNDLRKIQEAKDPKGSLWWRNTDNIFKEVINADKGSVSPTMTNFLSNLRTVATMARLPFIAIDSISDVGYVASFAQRMGIDYSRAYLNQMQHIFDTFPTEERRRIASLFYTQTQSHLGFLGRFSQNNSASDYLNKISTGFFKKIQLDAFDRGNKVGIMHLMAKHLADSDMKLGAMNEKTADWIRKFLTEDEWNVLRKKNQKGLFTTENVDALTDDEVRSLHAKSGTLMPLTDVRDDLHRKVHSMFSVASENAVLSPGEFESAMLLQGTQSGTPAGELLRMFMHFKMYAMSYIDRVLMQGFKEADTFNQKIIWATSMLAGTIPLSVTSMFLHNLSQGLSMPDWNEMNVPDREKYLLSVLAPSLAIFSGILDPKNQNGGLIFSLLGSPSVSLIGYSLGTPLALLSGNPEQAGKNLGRAANYIFPIQTTPVISPIIRQALGQEAHLEPGQTHYFGS